MSPSEFVQQLVNALSLGSIYALLALGLSMVYGVLGMLNFAYGELVTITGYSMLAATYLGAPFVVVAVIGVAAAGISSVLMELVAFRPLRNASFVSLLFTSFAVAQLIQGAFRQAVSVRSRGIPVPTLFDEAVQLGSVRIGVLPIITASIGAISLVALTTFMRRSRSGLAMRAASQDFTTARLLGVRANRVISLAFLISGALAGVAGVLWIARTTSVNPDDRLRPRDPGLHRLGDRRARQPPRRRDRRILPGHPGGLPAGAAPGLAAAVRAGILVADRRRDPVRAAAGPVRAAGRGRMTGPIPAGRLRPALWGSAVISLLLIGGMLLVRSFGTASSGRTYVVFLVNVMLVVSIQAFIGNSGVVSFGHVAFMGIGAYTTALVTIPDVIKTAQLPDLPSAIATADLGLLPAVVLSAAVAGIVAAIFGGGMIRMTESTMAMATLALLVVVHTFLQNATTFTRGSLGLAAIPVRTTLGVATIGAVAFLLLGRLYKDSGPGLRLRATREDPLSAASVGTNVIRTRYGAWILSAAMMGAAGSLWAQSVIAFNANQFYFAITFSLLAMLVIGGRTSITGAVAGAAIITFLTDTLARVEQGVAIGPWELPRITGTVQFVIALLIIVTLILRPEGHLRPVGDRRPGPAAGVAPAAGRPRLGRRWRRIPAGAARRRRIRPGGAGLGPAVATTSRSASRD